MKTKLLIALGKKIKDIPDSNQEEKQWWNTFRTWIQTNDFRKLDREFFIEYDNPDDATSGGIYKFFIGEKYWVARTKKLHQRKKSWEQQINMQILSDEPSPPGDHFLYPFIAQIIETGTTKGRIVIVEHCDEDQLMPTEQRWLDKSKGDKDCLNTTFIAKDRNL